MGELGWQMAAYHGGQDYIRWTTPLQPKYNQLQSIEKGKYLMHNEISNTWHTHGYIECIK